VAPEPSQISLARKILVAILARAHERASTAPRADFATIGERVSRTFSAPGLPAKRARLRFPSFGSALPGDRPQDGIACVGAVRASLTPTLTMFILRGNPSTRVIPPFHSLRSSATVGMKIGVHVLLTGKRAIADVVYVDPEQPRHCGINLENLRTFGVSSSPPDDWQEKSTVPD
jgi:hypothetical protein